MKPIVFVLLKEYPDGRSVVCTVVSNRAVAEKWEAKSPENRAIELALDEES